MTPSEHSISQGSPPPQKRKRGLRPIGFWALVLSVFIPLCGVVLLLKTQPYGSIIQTFFLGNLFFNGAILFVFCLSQSFALFAGWQAQTAKSFLETRNDDLDMTRQIPRSRLLWKAPLLSPLQSLSTEPHDSSRVMSRMAEIQCTIENREVWVRFCGSSLLYLGLLGTFVGLLIAISGVSDVISGLSLGGLSLSEILTGFHHELKIPLGGMEIAFSSSLFGLGGSLVCGVSSRLLQQIDRGLLLQLEAIFTRLHETEESKKDLSSRTVEATVLSNLQTVARLEKLSERQIKWFDYQAGQGSQSEIVAIVERRLEQIDNILVRMVSSLNDITNHLPKENLYEKLSEEFQKIEKAAQENLKHNREQMRQRLLEREDFQEFLRDELRILGRVFDEKRKSEQTLS